MGRSYCNSYRGVLALAGMLISESLRRMCQMQKGPLQAAMLCECGLLLFPVEKDPELLCQLVFLQLTVNLVMWFAKPGNRPRCTGHILKELTVRPPSSVLFGEHLHASWSYPVSALLRNHLLPSPVNPGAEFVSEWKIILCVRVCTHSMCEEHCMCVYVHVCVDSGAHQVS